MKFRTRREQEEIRRRADDMTRNSYASAHFGARHVWRDEADLGPEGEAIRKILAERLTRQTDAMFESIWRGAAQHGTGAAFFGFDPGAPGGDRTGFVWRDATGQMHAEDMPETEASERYAYGSHFSPGWRAEGRQTRAGVWEPGAVKAPSILNHRAYHEFASEPGVAIAAAQLRAVCAELAYAPNEARHERADAAEAKLRRRLKALLRGDIARYGAAL